MSQKWIYWWNSERNYETDLWLLPWTVVRTCVCDSSGAVLMHTGQLLWNQWDKLIFGILQILAVFSNDMLHSGRIGSRFWKQDTLPTLLPLQNTAHDGKSQAVQPFRRQQVSDAGLQSKDFLSVAEIQQRNQRDHCAIQPSQDLGQLFKAQVILATHDLPEDVRPRFFFYGRQGELTDGAGFKTSSKPFIN